jgi:hypothetical protein
VGIGFYILEIVGVITAFLLLSGVILLGWILAVGFAAGPLIGYILSRGVGLPDFTEDPARPTHFPLGYRDIATSSARYPGWSCCKGLDHIRDGA